MSTINSKQLAMHDKKLVKNNLQYKKATINKMKTIIYK